MVTYSEVCRQINSYRTWHDNAVRQFSTRSARMFYRRSREKQQSIRETLGEYETTIAEYGDQIQQLVSHGAPGLVIDILDAVQHVRRQLDSTERAPARARLSEHQSKALQSISAASDTHAELKARINEVLAPFLADGSVPPVSIRVHGAKRWRQLWLDITIPG